MKEGTKSFFLGLGGRAVCVIFGILAWQSIQRHMKENRRDLQRALGKLEKLESLEKLEDEIVELSNRHSLLEVQYEKGLSEAGSRQKEIQAQIMLLMQLIRFQDSSAGQGSGDVVVSEKELSSKRGMLDEKEKEGLGLLMQGKYAASYRVYDAVVQGDADRLLSRYYRVYSLFYRNPLDKAEYNRILTEISVLKAAGFWREEMAGIERFISAERAIE